MESPQVMKKRLQGAYAKFGERLRAVGPDCGLGSWPSQDLAVKILANCAAAVQSFRLGGRTLTMLSDPQLDNRSASLNIKIFIL